MAVEDLYRPYRPKRRTRAAIARERGLEPLADLIWLQNTKRPLEEEAEAYVSEEKGVADAEAALAGAGDILAERIADEAAYRKEIRRRTFQKGILKSAAKDEKVPSVYEMYYGFEEPAAKIAGHRILAVNRGEKEKFLTVKLQAPEEEILCYLEKQVILRENPYTAPLLREVIADSYRRLIAPTLPRRAQVLRLIVPTPPRRRFFPTGDCCGSSSPVSSSMKTGKFRSYIFFRRTTHFPYPASIV